ncbi:hypothetical protein SMIR_41150 (plasmid) [Streptomyces mirabilis]|uniref:hypothetical protein n=1 Tax=Streptomyces mirabilis TaxID=68239 RepID=UPI001BAEC1BE|nr:hypothetical protein [Streptomyces mirabilis]QUW85485.1 hypothetical protein SMIR_41150 [Streptomyces mirabilis]
MPQLLYPLLLLACPVGMGLMMWFMMRGGAHTTQRSDTPSTHAELDELRREIADLRAAQKDARHPLRS